MSGRFVVLGVARSRQSWFVDLARWSTTAAVPIDFVKCLTIDEVRAILGSGRRISAILVDSGISGVDRELVALADAADAAVVVVADGRVTKDWDALGCAAVLGDRFDRDELVDALARHARPVERHTRSAATASVEPGSTRTTTLLGVVGSGGVGTSTIAMALAQALAADLANSSVALADGARRGDLAMYHDVGDVIPGLPELVEAHRSDHPDPVEIRRLLFRIIDRRYDLLLGMRRPRDWVTMRPRSVEAALAGLGRAYDTVVVDVDPDLEGEAETGSMDVEDRHSVTRSVTSSADLLLVVGLAGVKGLNDIVRLLDELTDSGVPRNRLLPVVNRAPRSPAARSTITSTLAQLTTPLEEEELAVCPPLFISDIRGVEQVHREVTALPNSMCRPLGRVVRRLLLDVGPRAALSHPGQLRLAPGELGVQQRDPFDGADGIVLRGNEPPGRSDVA